MRKLINFLSDKKLLIGIGIGIIIGTIFMSFDNYNYKMSKAQIEEKARGCGMKYPDECKVIFKSDKDKK